MSRKNIIWLYLFLIVGICDLFFIAQGEFGYRIFSKPLLMLCLLIYFIQFSKNIRGTILRKSISAALFFSMLGDILFLFPQLLLYGLGAFLMVHICYIIGFKLSQIRPFVIGKVDFIRLFFQNLPIYILSGVVYFLIHQNLNELKIPIVIYLLVLVTMVTTARERYRKTMPSSFWQVFIGAIIFLISDGIWALNHFFRSFEEARVLEMGTYMIAQLLIIMGLRSHILALKLENPEVKD
jgi:uncharacterized membrane protein YhhN